jgi:predicted nucleic acid-binding protein
LEKVTRQGDGSFVISFLCRVEVTNAIELRAFRKERNSEEVSASIEAFYADIEVGVFTCVPVPPSAWDIALKLSRSHTSKTGTRSLDILHVAGTLALKASAFLTFDRNQARLARAVGLALPVRP